MGQPSDLILPHAKYFHLEADAENRHLAYRCVFASRLFEQVITEILDDTNKAWVPGNEHFKLQIQAQLNFRVEPVARGGDRKSELFKTNRLVAAATVKSVGTSENWKFVFVISLTGLGRTATFIEVKKIIF